MTDQPSNHAPIVMADLAAEYRFLKTEIDEAVQKVLASGRFIGGSEVDAFSSELNETLKCHHSITSGNGTDALQIALMALDLKPGDEVIVPAFTYFATAEVVSLLRLKPIFVDVSPQFFTILPEEVEKAVTKRTKAIIAVHLFGVAAPLEPLIDIAQRHELFLIEDCAQSFATTYRFADGHVAFTGTVGDVGCHSFFPTKNLACYGDGGALTTNNPELAATLKQIANHGQERRYFHNRIGVNSRLDALQAAILRVKLRHLPYFLERRATIAEQYHAALSSLEPVLTLPQTPTYSTHTYHQFTISTSYRDKLQHFLADQGIASNIYYPLALHQQKAFLPYGNAFFLPNSEQCAKNVLSIPMHPLLQTEAQQRVIDAIKSFFSSL